jgi:tetratricopeptide (TPR) repeat protein
MTRLLGILVLGLAAAGTRWGQPPQAPAWPEGYRVRWPLQVVGDPAKQTAQTVIASLPTGGWLKPDASDVAVYSASGKPLPLRILSHHPAGDTLIQFQRDDNASWYWAYGVNAQATAPPKFTAPPKEGLSLEVIEWAGDSLESWVKVREGLQKSGRVLGNAVAAEVVQNANPARPDSPRRFAVSYRGFLDIKKDGVYRFFVNADDAAFLFIDGFRVFERPGTNSPLQAKFPLKGSNGQVELKAGVHSLEVHHLVGDNPTSNALCSLLWLEPDPKKPSQVRYAFVPRGAFVQPMFARAAAAEGRDGGPAVGFAYGLDDMLSSGALTVFLVHFEAQGQGADGDSLAWDFGDGTTGKGRSATHVYFRGGAYTVTLKGPPGLPPFRREVYVWPAPGENSPLSLGRAVRALAESDWPASSPERLKQIFAFARTCEQPERWPLLGAVAERLLGRPDLDLKERAQLVTTRMEALAAQGQAQQALKLYGEALPQFARVPSLKISLQLAAAGVYQYHLKDAAAASQLYRTIVEDNRRLELPDLRRAAVRWGDLFAETGDNARAAETYRMAAGLGGEKFAAAAQAAASTRGARLRIAEQALRRGDVHQTRALLTQLELDHPAQKLEGPFRFLRAESDRLGGRYEESLRHYEVLLRLPQWAGYRDRALAGIADTYFRMGKLDRALEWYATLRKSFPAYYEKQDLDAVRKRIEARRKRLAKGIGSRKSGVGGWDDSSRPFFPDSRLPTPDSRFAAGDSFFEQKMPDLNDGGWYWAELWYRETLASPPVRLVHDPRVYLWIAAEGSPPNQVPTTYPVPLERTYGHWRKIGVKMHAPAPDGRLRLSVRSFLGMMELSGLSVRPVSDLQVDTLRSFTEGTDPP